MRLPSLFFALFTGISATSSVGQVMDATEQNLFDKLMSKQSFKDLIPTGQTPDRISLEGSVIPGPIKWGSAPLGQQLRPIGFLPIVSRNCLSEGVLAVRSFAEPKFEQKSVTSLTTNWNVELGIEVTPAWPVNLSKASFKAGYGEERTKETADVESIKFRSEYEILVPEGLEAVSQVQVLERKIDGMPFEMKVEVGGNAALYFDPAVRWEGYSGRIPGDAVKDGKEPVEDGTRKLPVCRYNGVSGKVVSGKCNYASGDKEFAKEDFDILRVGRTRTEWMDHEEFYNSYSKNEIDQGLTPAVLSNRTNQNGERIGPPSLVCLAKRLEELEVDPFWNFFGIPSVTKVTFSDHPGIVRDGNCEYGYGGKRVREDKRFRILLAHAERGDAVTFDLAKHLDRDERVFDINGTFDDARAISAEIVVSAMRPVDRSQCAIIDDSGVDDGGMFELIAEAEPATNANNASLQARAVGGDSPEPLPNGDPFHDVLDGTPLLTLDLRDDGQQAKLNSRVLRLSDPLMYGTDVLAIQRALIARGWPVKPDGFYGGWTAKAVADFQRAHRLPVDGIMGRVTQRRLGL